MNESFGGDGMPEFITNLKWGGLMVLSLIAAGLACNMPGSGATDTPTATVTSSPTVEQVQPTLGLPETVPAVFSTATAEALTQTPLPSFTPIQPPTLAPTLTPSIAPTRRPSSGNGGAATNTPEPTDLPDEDQGPLSFSYHIEWRLQDASAKQAIATVTINAQGGGGGYTYFRDEIQVDGPVFEYTWATCAGNPGSFRVTAADGQTLKMDYFSNPPCPTFTPTP
jgi:hypothetical protein